jgi:hypothetical protein
MKSEKQSEERCSAYFSKSYYIRPVVYYNESYTRTTSTKHTNKQTKKSLFVNLYLCIDQKQNEKIVLHLYFYKES